MANHVEIKGLDQLNRALRQLEPKLAKKGIRRAMRKAIRPIQDAVKDRAPVDSGQFKRSIKVRAGRGGRNRIVLRVVMGADAFKAAFYGAFRDLGTEKLDGADSMRDGFDATKEGVKTELERLILEEIEKELT